MGKIELDSDMVSEYLNFGNSYIAVW